MKTYFVHILSNKSRILYTGVTGNLERRVSEHKRKLRPGFTHRYHLNCLVYYETFGDIRTAIQREKQLKGWVRTKKVSLILANNPAWRDLSKDWCGGKQAIWHSCAAPSRIIRWWAATRRPFPADARHPEPSPVAPSISFSS